jgi:hypothetical protein
MKNKSPLLEEEVKRIRIQGRAQIIIMISSLIFIFLWFTLFSSLFNQSTFSQETFEYFGELAGFSSSFLIIFIAMITAGFTVVYIYLIRHLAQIK